MEVIIVGAGASGLMAAYELGRKGIGVTVLEAENRIGGRIRTFTPPGFLHEIEAGAEFIHGDLPLTMRLMKKAGLSCRPATGKMYNYENGLVKPREGERKGWNRFYEKLAKVRRDLTLEAFVTKHFSDDKYSVLREEVFAMAQGLDLADPAKVGVIGLKHEWLSEQPQYRPQAGYGRLIEFLYDESVRGGMRLHLGQEVSKINWEKGAVEVFAGDSKYVGEAVILTLPVPLMQRREIRFSPNIDQKLSYYKSIGFGNVIKFSIEFSDAFWEADFNDLGFLFAEGGMTFWTQLSDHKPLLTGWIGGAGVSRFKSVADAALLEIAIERLQQCFQSVPVAGKFKNGAVFRYTEDTASGGGYSWLMPESKNAISEINNGVENTIWFAGEALHPGAEPGTVEAALQSGRFAARRIAYGQF